MLLASGPIAGVLLALPFALARRTHVLRLARQGFRSYADTLAVLVFLVFVFWLYEVAISSPRVPLQGP